MLIDAALGRPRRSDRPESRGRSSWCRGIGILSTGCGSSYSRSCTWLEGEPMESDQLTMPSDESTTSCRDAGNAKGDGRAFGAGFGIALMAAGIVLGVAMTIVGGVLLFVGLVSGS